VDASKVRERREGVFPFRPLAQAHREPELGADPFGAVHADLAPHPFRQFLGDGQPQAGAAVSARGRRIRLGELLEQRPALVRRNPDPRVPDGKADGHFGIRLGKKLRLHHDLSPVRELHGVARQVGENLAKAVRVAAQIGRQVRGNGADELDPLLVGVQGGQDGEIIQEGAQIEVLGAPGGIRRCR